MCQGRRRRTLIRAIKLSANGAYTALFLREACATPPMPPSPTAARRIAAAVLTVMLAVIAGCSAVRLGYNQADVILAWRADDYFDFDPQQKQEFAKRLMRLLEWHRRDQLPDYAQFIAEMQKRLQRHPAREDAVWVVEGFKGRYRNIVNRGVNDAADLLAMMKTENLRALEQQFEKDNRKFVREFRLDGSIEQRRQARLERTLKQIKEWTGSLSHQQEERIAALQSAMPLIEHLRLQDRQRRQREFLAMLRLRDNKPEFLPLLHNWLLYWERGRSADYIKQVDDVYEKRITLYLEVERMLTPQQRAHLVKKLQDYIDDIKALTAKPASTPQ